jgi:DnaJ-class molecular chaperone
MNRATAYKKCPRCNGSGLYFDRGICFSCGGKGSYIADRFTLRLDYPVSFLVLQGR